MDNMRSFLDEARTEHNKELAAAKRQLAAADRKGQAPRKAQAARGAKGKAAAAKVPACSGGGRACGRVLARVRGRGLHCNSLVNSSSLHSTPHPVLLPQALPKAPFHASPGQLCLQEDAPLVAADGVAAALEVRVAHASAALLLARANIRHDLLLPPLLLLLLQCRQQVVHPQVSFC